MSDTGGGHRASAEAIKATFNEQFGDKYQAELRKELEMEGHLPAVLLMGGGEGKGPIEATAQALSDAPYNERLGEPIGQVLVICRRNKKLADRLNSVDWKIPVQAGPGTIAEAMIRGLPIILNGYIAGQKSRTLIFPGAQMLVLLNPLDDFMWKMEMCHILSRIDAGNFSQSPKERAKIVGQWIGPRQDEVKVMSLNALKLAKPDAVFKMFHDMHELLRQRSFVPPA